MQIRIEDVSPVEKKLVVEVPWATVNDKLNAAYRDLSRNVNMRGFRKGKVPRSVLQQVYGKQVRTEVATQLLREGFVSANSQHNLQAVAEPRVESLPEIKAGQPLSFEAVVEVKGDIVAKDYSGMELVQRRVDVSDEEVDKQLEALRREHAELQPIEGRDTTANTDVLTIKLKGTIGDQEVERDQIHIDLTEPERDPLPGMIQALTGLPINVQDHVIELALPEDLGDQQVAGKTARLTISIVDARKKEMPALDDDFAKDIDRGETLAALRQSLRDELSAKRREVATRELKERAVKELVKRNPIPLAPALIDRGIQYQFYQLRSMLGQAAGSIPLTASLRESLRPAAIEQLRGDLLVEAIANQENLAVTDEKLDAHIEELAKGRGTQPARLRAELDRDGELDSVRYQLRHDMVLDLLIQRAKVEEIDSSAYDALQEQERQEAMAKLEAAAGEAASLGGHDHSHHDHDHHHHDHSHHDHDHHHHDHSHHGHDHGHHDHSHHDHKHGE